MSKKPQRVLWAIDAFSKDTALTATLESILRRWGKGSDVEVEPVYILSPDQLSLPEEVFAQMLPENELEAKNRLSKTVRRSKLPNLLPPTLLVSSDFSLRTAVKTLVEHAHSRQADLIAVGTQSKKAVTRFLLGSFAETLVLQSDIPVLVVTPHTRPSPNLKNVIFATDLSGASEVAFEKVLELAQRQKMHVTIFHKVEYLSEYTIDLASKNPRYENLLESDLIRRTRTLEAMAAEAGERGISASVVLDSKPDTVSITDALLRATRKGKGDLIAIASQSGPFVATLLGSVARQILRKAKYPIWIVHPPRMASDVKPRENTRTQGAA